MPERPATLRDLRRDQILDAARALVAEGGLDALTIASLERVLPFSRGVITYHFDNKDEIVAAVLQSAVVEIDGATLHAVATSGPADARLRAVLRGMVGGYLGHEEAGRILLAFWGRAHGSAPIAAMTRDLFARYRAMSGVLLAEGQAEGLFRQDLDVEGVAALMVGSVVGTVIQGYLDGRVQGVALAEVAATTVLEGVRTPRA